MTLQRESNLHKGREGIKKSSKVAHFQSLVIALCILNSWLGTKNKRSCEVSQSTAEENYRDSLKSEFPANYTIKPPTPFKMLSLLLPPPPVSGEQT